MEFKLRKYDELTESEKKEIDALKKQEKDLKENAKKIRLSICSDSGELFNYEFVKGEQCLFRSLQDVIGSWIGASIYEILTKDS